MQAAGLWAALQHSIRRAACSISMTPDLDNLSNDAENFGGMMTEVHICSSVTGGNTFGNTCN